MNASFVATHELGHALVGRALGKKTLLVVTTPDRGFTDHEPSPEPDSLGALAEAAITLAAGRYATDLIDWTQFDEPPPADTEVAFAAALNRLPVEDGGFVYYVVTDTRSGPNDEDKLAAIGLGLSAFEEERDLFIRYCESRAWRMVVELAPMIEALVPLALRNPILTGDDLEAGIAEAEVGVGSLGAAVPAHTAATYRIGKPFDGTAQPSYLARPGLPHGGVHCIARRLRRPVSIALRRGG